LYRIERHTVCFVDFFVPFFAGSGEDGSGVEVVCEVAEEGAGDAAEAGELVEFVGKEEGEEDEAGEDCLYNFFWFGEFAVLERG
jgi:hypothetical protein